MRTMVMPALALALAMRLVVAEAVVPGQLRKPYAWNGHNRQTASLLYFARNWRICMRYV
jgi:hypothetical protein